VIFSDSLTTIGRSAFYGCRKGLNNQVLTIQLPSTVKTIGPCAFYCCYEATSINIPDAVTEIGDSALYKCQNLRSVRFPEGITRIGDRMFLQNYQLTTFTIPESVTLLGKNVFEKCNQLTELTCLALTPPDTYSATFTGITPADVVLRVWPSRVGKYSTKLRWKDFYNIQTIDCGSKAKLKTTYDTISQGEVYTWRGKQYTTSVTRRDTTTNQYGCDTIIYRLKLTVLSVPTPICNTPQTNREDDTRKLIHHDRLLIYREGSYYDALGHPVPMEN